MNDFEEYIRQGEPQKREKGYAWQTAIGLQAVDDLKPSEYLIQTARQHIEGDITIEEAKQLIEEEFLLVPRDERPQLAEEVIRRALSRSDTEVVLIDGINVLFAPILNLNPLELLKTISKTYPIVVGWRGHLEGDQLYLEHNNDPKHAVVTITKPDRVMVID